MMTSKINDRHLSRTACVYIRQSTVAQVRFNQESTERQYNLASKAESLGWSPERIRILDRDLGQSGARTTNREDFKSLVSDVAMGNVGAIFSLEASRLARSNQDWHRLLELCAITSTLVIDEDGRSWLRSRQDEDAEHRIAAHCRYRAWQRWPAARRPLRARVFGPRF